MAAGLNESYAYARVSFPRAFRPRRVHRVPAAYNYNITYEIMKLIL